MAYFEPYGLTEIRALTGSLEVEPLLCMLLLSSTQCETDFPFCIIGLHQILNDRP
jgi:hypothetical protein